MGTPNIFNAVQEISLFPRFLLGFARRTGDPPGPYASKMIPRGLTPFSGPTRSGLHGKCQITILLGGTYSDIYSK